MKNGRFAARASLRLLMVALPLALAACGYSQPRDTLYDWNLDRDPGAAEGQVGAPPRQIAATHEAEPVSYLPVEKRREDVTVASLPAPTHAESFEWPLQGRIISAFGAKMNGERNDGINIASDYGIPIHAAAAGTVTYAGNELKGYGNLVLIKHDDGYVTAYAHAENLVVNRGEIVRAGQVIGYVGDTGGVPAPQLHFEIRRGKVPVDPLTLLSSQNARS